MEAGEHFALERSESLGKSHITETQNILLHVSKQLNQSQMQNTQLKYIFSDLEYFETNDDCHVYSSCFMTF